MINSKTKDKILYKLVRESPEMTFAFDSEDSMAIFGYDPEVVSSVLDYFEEIGLIDQDKFLEGEIMVEILIPAHDLVAHGGFTSKEDLLTKNIEQLLVEIESLKSLLPEKTDTIAALASEIKNGLARFSPVKKR